MQLRWWIRTAPWLLLRFSLLNARRVDDDLAVRASRLNRAPGPCRLLCRGGGAARGDDDRGHRTLLIDHEILDCSNGIALRSIDGRSDEL